MIIIEGVDNSGKSTLAEKLSEKFGIPVVHSVRPEPTASESECYYHSVVQLNHQNAILDRVYSISEWVYGPVIRGKSALGEYHQLSLMELYSRDNLIVYCRPPNSIILDNQGREQMDGVVNKHLELINRYDTIMTEVQRFGSGRFTAYDWTSSINTNYVVDQCFKHLEKKREQGLSVKFLSGK